MKGPLITSRMNKSRRQCWLHKIRVSLWIKQGRWNVVVDFVVSLEEASAGRRGASACYISNYRPIDTADTNYKALAQHKAYNNTDIQADTKTRQCETIFVAQWKKGNFLLSVFPANQHLICDGQLQWLLQVKKKETGDNGTFRALSETLIGWKAALYVKRSLPFPDSDWRTVSEMKHVLATDVHSSGFNISLKAPADGGSAQVDKEKMKADWRKSPFASHGNRHNQPLGRCLQLDALKWRYELRSPAIKTSASCHGHVSQTMTQIELCAARACWQVNRKVVRRVPHDPQLLAGNRTSCNLLNDAIPFHSFHLRQPRFTCWLWRWPTFQLKVLSLARIVCGPNHRLLCYVL